MRTDSLGESSPFLADHPDQGDRVPPEVRAALRRFVALGLCAVLAIGFTMTWIVRRQIDDLAVEQAVQQTERLAAGTVAPFVSLAVMDGEPAALTALDRIVRARLDGSGLQRVLVRMPDGRRIYDSAGDFAVTAEGLPEPAARALADGVPRAALVQPADSGRTPGVEGQQFVRVDVAAVASGGGLIAIEARHDLDVVTAQADLLLQRVGPFLWVALGALALTQLPSAVLLALRIDRGERARRALLAEVVASAEVERRRLARDLHDTVIQDLSGLAYALQGWEGIDRRSGEQLLLRNAHEILLGAVATLRNTLTSLHPFDLEEIGLREAILRLAHGLERRGVVVTVSVPAETIAVLDRSTTVAVYRLVREALSNVAKHADAGTVLVLLAVRGEQLVAEVRDDGRGFDVEQKEAADHFGLPLLRSASSQADGRLEVRSVVGEGTSVVLRLAIEGIRPTG